MSSPWDELERGLAELGGSSAPTPQDPAIAAKQPFAPDRPPSPLAGLERDERTAVLLGELAACRHGLHRVLDELRELGGVIERLGIELGHELGRDE